MRKCCTGRLFGVSTVPARFAQLQPRLQRYSTSPPQQARNRIYDSVRQPSEFDTLLLLSTSANTPLITFWSAIWCPPCKTVLPLIKDLIESSAVTPSSSSDLASGALAFAEVELSSSLIGDLGVRYGINSIPTLLSFSRGEPQHETKVTRMEDLKNRDFLIRWLEQEKRRGGNSGASGGWFR